MKKPILFMALLWAAMNCLSQSTGDPVILTGKINIGQAKPENVSVMTLFSNTSTTIDKNGVFRIPVTVFPDTLIVSHIGYRTEMVPILLNTRDLNIVLQIEASSLEEVVINTSFGIEKRSKQLGYAAETISGQDITKAAPLNVLGGLTGKVAGLNISALNSEVTQDMRVNLRGVRSLTGNNTPLFVIDGSPLVTEQVIPIINSINPADIESVTVLKGANASALYGPEGVNGAIIVTTKKGRSRSEINFSHSTMLQQVDRRYPKYQEKFGSGSLTNEFGDGVYNPTDNQSWGPAFDGSMRTIGRPDENGEVQQVPYSFNKNERFRFFNTGLTIQNAISLAGSDSRSNYLASLSHTDFKGIIPGDKLNRVTARFNGGRSFGILRANVNAGYFNTRSNRSSNSVRLGVFSGLVQSPGNIPITRYSDFENDKWADKNHYFSDFHLNPYEETNLRRIINEENGLVGNVEFIMTLAHGAVITNRTGLNFSSSTQTNEDGDLTFSEFALANGGSGRDISSSNLPAGVSDNFRSRQTVNNDLFVTLSRDLSRFSLQLTAGNVMRNQLNKELRAGNAALIIPNLFTYSNGSGMSRVSKSITRTRLASFFSTLNLGHDDKIFVEITARRDWNSKVSPGQNKSLYAGANGSLILTELLPALKRNVFSYVKLRGAYNVTANVNIGAYQLENQFFTASGFPYGNLPGFRFLFPGRPNIKPESVKSQEYGIELRALADRLSLDVSYYHQRNDDQILSIDISSAAGFESVVFNAGSFYNKGWEFTGRYGSNSKTKKAINFSLEANLSINESKVLSLYKDQKMLFAGSSTVAAVGHPAFVFALNDWIRDSLGRVIVDQHTGLPQYNSEPTLLGRNTPKYIMGISGEINWRNFGLKAVGEYRGGYNYYHALGSNLDFYGVGEGTTINDRERFVFPNSVFHNGQKYQENTDVVVNNAGSPFYSGLYFLIGTNYYSSGAFWKLRELVVSYSIPFKPGGTIERATVSLSARNLLAFYPRTNRWGDPEQAFSNASEVTGDAGSSSVNNLAGVRYFGAGLNFSF